MKRLPNRVPGAVFLKVHNVGTPKQIKGKSLCSRGQNTDALSRRPWSEGEQEKKSVDLWEGLPSRSIREGGVGRRHLSQQKKKIYEETAPIRGVGKQSSLCLTEDRTRKDFSSMESNPTEGKKNQFVALASEKTLQPSGKTAFIAGST